MKGKTAAAAALTGVFGLLVLRYAQQTAQAVREGLLLCGTVLIPSLFPFLVLSSLVIELGAAQGLGTLSSRWMYSLFGVGGTGASALLLGLIGGYPIGAKTICQLYSRGQCTREEALRLLTFCCSCGPGFILGVVGVGLFGSQKIGLLLWAVHVVSALLIGLSYRLIYGKVNNLSAYPVKGFSPCSTCSSAFLRAVTGALQSCLNITAFVLCFSGLDQLLVLSGLISSGSRIGQLLAGILELSSGVAGLAQSSMPFRLSAAAFFLGWGGLSVHCQTLVFLNEAGLPPGSYLTGKLLHGLLSALLIRPFGRILTVEAFLPQGAPRLPGLIQTLSRSVSFSLVLWLLAALVMVHLLKNYGGKSL